MPRTRECTKNSICTTYNLEPRKYTGYLRKYPKNLHIPKKYKPLLPNINITYKQRTNGFSFHYSADQLEVRRGKWPSPLSTSFQMPAGDGCQSSNVISYLFKCLNFVWSLGLKFLLLLLLL